MRHQLILIVVSLLLGLAAAGAQAEVTGTVPVEPRAGAFHEEALDDAERIDSDAGDRQRLVLTLYQSGPAQIAERREVGLGRSARHLRLLDVAASIQPETLLLSGEAELDIKGIRLHDRRPSRDNLLAAYQGREVRLVRETADGSEAERQGTIVSAGDGAAVVHVDGRLETIDEGHPWRIVFDAMPDHLVPEPVLDLALTSDVPGRQWIDLSYLAHGLDWQVDYVVMLDADGARMDLDAWAGLRNRTATRFADADIRLVAGASGRTPARLEALAAPEAGAAVGASEAVADQYRFRLERPMALEPGDRQQLRFLSATEVPVTREYRVQGSLPFGRQGRARLHPVTVHLSFDNTEPGPGQPLPSGTLRVYQRDADGEPILAGEDALRATPVGEEVTLMPGAAFDLTAERRQTDYRRLHERTEEQAWEVRLRNAGDTGRTIVVEETLPGDWTILEESSDHERPEAGRARWELVVPAGGEEVLRYRVEVRR